MRKRLLLCYLAAGIFMSAIMGRSAVCQELEIDSSFSVESAQPGDQVTLQVNLVIPEGFHIYGSKNQNNATAFSFDDSVALAVSGDPEIPEGKQIEGKVLPEYWLEGKVALKQTFTVGEQAAGETALNGELQFVICSEKRCKPPAKKSFTATLKVVAGQDQEKMAGSKLATTEQGKKGDKDVAAEKKKLRALVKELNAFFRKGDIGALEKQMTKHAKVQFVTDTLFLLDEFTYDGAGIEDEGFEDEEFEDEESEDEEFEEGDLYSDEELDMIDELIDISDEYDLSQLDVFYPDSARTKAQMYAYDVKLFEALGPDEKRVKILNQIVPRLVKLAPDYGLLDGSISKIEIFKNHANITVSFADEEEVSDEASGAGNVLAAADIFRFKRSDSGWMWDGFDDVALDAMIKESSQKTLENVRLIGETFDGKKVHLESYRGKVVLIDFWGTWCSPCIAELPELKKIHGAMKEHGFEIIGVAADSKEQLKGFFEESPLPWPSIVDAKSKIVDKFGVSGFPTLLLMDQEGNHVASGLHGVKLVDEIIKRLDLKKSDFKDLRSDLK